MRIVVWLIFFVFLLAFAGKNLDPVTLRFYLGESWQAPLIVVLLAFFAAGAAFGMVAVSGTLLRQRREIARLRREGRKPREADLQGGSGPLRPPAIDA